MNLLKDYSILVMRSSKIGSSTIVGLKMKKIFLSTALFFLFLSCKEEISDPIFNHSSVTGFLYESVDTFEPIRNAVITIDNQTVKTDEAGQFVFERIIDKKIKITALHNQFGRIDTSFSLRGDAKLNLYMKKIVPDEFPNEIGYTWWFSGWDSINQNPFSGTIKVFPDTFFAATNIRQKYWLASSELENSELIGQVNVKNDTVYLYDVPIIIFPLEKGMKWSYFKNSGTYEFEVIAKKKLTVPLGRFDNVWEIYFSFKDLETTKHVWFWFEPKIGIIKEYSFYRGFFGTWSLTRELSQISLQNK